MHLLGISIAQERFPTTMAYPFHLSIFQATRRISLEAPVCFFVGENGSGKSTLLSAIARAAGIHIWERYDRSRAHDNPYEARLASCLDLEGRAGRKPGSFFSAEHFRDFAERLDAWGKSDPGLFAYFGGGSLTEKSHGQCNMAFFANRFGVEGLYLLDEPESALSPRRQLELMALIQRAAQTGLAQFIVATHSPILLSLPGARILGFDGPVISPTTLEATDHYRVYRDFFTTRAG
jgi:predicted ATPase